MTYIISYSMHAHLRMHHTRRHDNISSKCLAPLAGAMVANRNFAVATEKQAAGARKRLGTFGRLFGRILSIACKVLDSSGHALA